MYKTMLSWSTNIINMSLWALQFLAESLDVIQDADWVISIGNSFTKQYELYASDDEHSGLLHRYRVFEIDFTFSLQHECYTHESAPFPSPKKKKRKIERNRTLHFTPLLYL